MNVGVVGYSGSVDSPLMKGIYETCLRLGEALAENNHIVFCGGRDGVMELVSEGVKRANGTVVGVLPHEEVGNEYLSLRIRTPFDNITRSLVLIESCDVVVSVGGEVGTAIEVLMAYAKSKPVILLTGTGGWTDRFSEILIEGKYLDSRKNVIVMKATTVEEVIRMIEEIGRKRKWVK
ncbi:MAG: TIGR00725 family protein [Pseudothermotoga sp.]